MQQRKDVVSRASTVSRPFHELRTINIGSAVISVSSTPHCSVIAAGAVDRSISVWSKRGILIWRHRLDNEVWATAVSADSSRTAAGTASKRPSTGSVYIFDAQGNQLFHYTVGAPIWGLSLSSDGRILAATSWNNYLYRFEESEEGYCLKQSRQIGSVGLYGVSLSHNGLEALVGVYDEGVRLVDAHLNNLKTYLCPAGAYHVSLTSDGRSGIVGLRDGRVMRIDLDRDTTAITGTLTERAICGVTTTPDGRLMLAGSFDGSMLALNKDLRVLWSLKLQGEIWDLSVSSDGTVLCIAGGDGTVRLITNSASVSALDEIAALEDRLKRPLSWPEKRQSTQSLLDAYLNYGLIEYGISYVEDMFEVLDANLIQDVVQQILLSDIKAYPNHYGSHYRLGMTFENSREWKSAAIAYLKASRDEALRSSALLHAGRCFLRCGMNSASMSCFRRAREQSLQEDEKHVLYNLARSYEDSGSLEEAKKHFEILLTWDPDYRNVRSRLDEIDIGAFDRRHLEQRPTDYTGLTASLLGPNVPHPKDVDEPMGKIIRARMKEVHVTSRERDEFAKALTWYGEHVITRHRDAESVSYDTIAYMKYDNLLPEDEIKKHLEAINLLAVLERFPRSVSLDVGTATGRHPTTLTSRGLTAFGVDVEDTAIAYAIKKRGGEEQYPDYRQGRADELPFEDEKFDLITCMMGTFAHLTSPERVGAVQEAFRCLQNDGLYVVSSWDSECHHLTYLAMYTHAEKEKISANALTKDEMAKLLEAHGFIVEYNLSFAMLPDVFSYEMGVQRLRYEDLARLVELDLAARGTFPRMHGQMYLIVGRKGRDVPSQ